MKRQKRFIIAAAAAAAATDVDAAAAAVAAAATASFSLVVVFTAPNTYKYNKPPFCMCGWVNLFCCYFILFARAS